MNILSFSAPTSKLFVSILEWLLLGICLACVGLFVFSAYEKLAEHRRFANGLSNAAYIGNIGSLLAWAVPVAELGIAALLILPGTKRYGLYAFASLMLLFTLYILIMLQLGEKFPCHCNLIVEQLSWPQHIWFNLGFVALAICGLWLNKKLKSLQQ